MVNQTLVSSIVARQISHTLSIHIRFIAIENVRRIVNVDKVPYLNATPLVVAALPGRFNESDKIVTNTGFDSVKNISQFSIVQSANPAKFTIE
jgi:hypothetical protein